MDQLLGDGAVEARQADVEARRQEEGAVGEVQVDLGIDRAVRRKRDLLPCGSEFDRAEVARRPGDAEEIFGRRVGLRQLEVDEAVEAAADAVGPVVVWVLPVKRTFELMRDSLG